MGNQRRPKTWPKPVPPAERVIGAFQIGELLPIKGCWLRVAVVEPGVLVLALDSYTQRGEEILEELRAQMATEQIAPEEGATV